MKAPNKIWLSKFEEDPGDNEYRIFEQWSLEPISNAENEEYVRKEALLEKLEKVAAEYKKRSDKGELVWQMMCGVKEAIDILNRM